VWGEYNVHFYVPFPSYAFATAHAWLALERAAVGPMAAMRESPSSFFATALKESYLGCSDKLPPLDLYHPGILYTRTAAYGDGCFQIESTTAWVEMCRMYGGTSATNATFPQTWDCSVATHDLVISSSNQDTLGRDNFASSVWVKAYYDTFAYAMLTTHGMPSPATWFAGASDPQAVVKTLAAMYNLGTRSGAADEIAAGCQHDLVEHCLGNLDYVVAVGSYDRELEATVAAGNCYNDVVSVNDVDDYISKITPLFTHEDGAALTAAGRAAFLSASNGAMTAPFQQVAGAVIGAIDDKMSTKLHCPEDEMTYWYMFHCPTH
jgi:hypothetical protein